MQPCVHKLTIGGRSGPRTRDEFLDTVKWFMWLHGAEPTHCTVTAEWVTAVAPAVLDPLTAGELTLSMVEKRETVSFFGLVFCCGQEYALWR